MAQKAICFSTKVHSLQSAQSYVCIYVSFGENTYTLYLLTPFISRELLTFRNSNFGTMIPPWGSGRSWEIQNQNQISPPPLKPLGMITISSSTTKNSFKLHSKIKKTIQASISDPGFFMLGVTLFLFEQSTQIFFVCVSL